MMAAQAVAMGIPPESATAIGNYAASTVAKSISFAQATTGHRSDTSATTNEQFPSLPCPGPGWQIKRKRPRLSQARPYKVGIGNNNNIGLAAPKPSWYTNKTLVIAGINKVFLNDKEGIKKKINILANRPINIQHMEVLSREVQGKGFDWLTNAIELSEDDFTHLLGLDSWESGIRIREYAGCRFWRQNRITKQDRLNSMRIQWK